MKTSSKINKYSIKTIIMKRLLIILLIGITTNSFAVQNQNNDSLLCENKYGNDSAMGKKMLSLFNQYFITKKYTKGFKYWRYLFEYAPCASKNVIVNGSFIVKEQIKAAGEEAERKALLYDTLFMAYDKALEYMEKDPKGYGGPKEMAEVKGYYAIDIVQNRPEDYQKAHQLFEETIKVLDTNSNSSVISYYGYSNAVMYQRQLIDLNQLLANYDLLNRIANHNINKGGDMAQYWQGAKDYVDKNVTPFLTCDALISVKESYVNENKENLEVLKEVRALLDKMNCTETQFYFNLAEMIYPLEPTTESAIALAKAYYSQGNITTAMKYYDDALPKLDENQKEEVYMIYARHYYEQRSYQKAASYVQKVLAINPNNGNAYILIGDCYRSDRCGGGTVGPKAAYWVAADMYMKAKSVDESVASTAQSRYNEVAGAFPKIDAIFKYDITDGQSYTVGCWINKTTIVRTKK